MGHVVAAADADLAFGALFRAATKKMTMAPELLDTDLHPPTPVGDEAVDISEPSEEDIMATRILDAEASDDEATPAPTAAETHVQEVADVEEPKLSK